MPQPIDPIKDRYFEPVERAERFSRSLFYLVALLSFAVLMVDQKASPAAYDFVQISFAISVIALFVLSTGIRLYWLPRADDGRRADLITSVTGVPLLEARTSDFYVSKETTIIRRLAAHVLQNSLFTKAVCLRMLVAERIKLALYLVLFLIVWHKRSTDPAWTAVAAQVVFSEQLLSLWLRIEWLRTRCERTYESVYAVLQSDSSPHVLYAQAMKWFVYYETSKANAGVVSSESVYNALKSTLEDDWSRVEAALKLDTEKKDAT